MTLPVSTLREKLVLANDMLVITPQFLQLESAADLFTEHLPDGVLRVLDATADHDRLQVTGQIALLDRQAGPGTVSFIVSPDGDDVVGVRVDIPLLGEDELPEALLPVCRVLGELRISTVHLVFGVEPAPTADLVARVGFGVELDFPSGDSHRPYLWGYLPLNSSQAWSLSGSFLPVQVPKISDLQQFAKETEHSTFALPPALATVAGALTLTDLAVTFAAPDQVRTTGYVQSVWLRVDVEGSWQIFDQLTVHDVHAEFGAIQPFGISPRLQGLIGGAVDLGDDIAIGTEISWHGNQVQVSGTLLRSVAVQPLLERHFPEFPLTTDLTVSELSVRGEFGGSSPGYGIDLVLDDVLEITPDVTLSQVVLSVNKQGTTTDASLDALWTLGETPLNVRGAWAKDDGWLVYAHVSHLRPSELFALFDIEPPFLLSQLELLDLGVAYDSANDRIDLSGTVAFPLGDAQATLTLTAELTRNGSGYDKHVTGSLSVAIPGPATQAAENGDLPGAGEVGHRVLEFTVDYREDGGAATVTGIWDTEPSLPLTDLVAALGIELPELPEVLRPELQALSVRYDTASKLVLLTTATERTGWVYASYPAAAPGSGRLSAAAVGARLSARASDLPLVGEAIPPSADLVLGGIAFTVAPAGWTPARAQEINAASEQVDPSPDRKLPRFSTDPQAGPGLAVQVELSIGGEPQAPLVLPISNGGTAAITALEAGTHAVLSPAGAGALTAASEGVALRRERSAASREIDQVFGPVRIRKVSLGYRNGLLFIAFDATLAVGPVQLDTIGLGLGLDSDFDVEPVLQGAGLRVDQPPLKVTGALVVREDDAFAIYIAGMVVVETGFFALQASGSYARSLDGWSSVFLFGEIAAVGGAALFEAPPFTLTAVSGGFGVNSTLRLPAIAELGQFPLIARLAERAPEVSSQEALEQLTAWVSPAEGRFWAAVGVEFALFKFIATRALAAVEFGDDLKVMLLGRTSVTFPRDTKPGRKVHARIDVDLRLAYQQSLGLLSLDVAVGDGSFVFDPACRLTGGIAIYLWTAGEHAGDFVISAGGYHPRLEERLDTQYPHYPTPARLGFTWSPDSKIMVKAEGYTALTPHALMFGGRLAASYTSGLLSAWFTAYLDVLVQWRPFYLDARLGIGIGVAFTIKVWFVKVRVSIEVGIDLALWTPPFGGRVTVKVWFVSFSFDIGTRRQELDAARWPEVHEQFPAPLSITPVAGLLADVDAGELAARHADGDPVLVAAAGLVLTVETVIPATAIHLNQDTDYATGPDGLISIRPMRKDRAITSEFAVTVTKAGDADYVISDDDWTVEVIERGAPAALWGRPLAEPDDALDDGQEALLPGQLAGLRFEVKPPETAGEIGPVTSAALQVTRVDPEGRTPLRNGAKQGSLPLPTPGSIEIIADTVNTSTTARRTGAYRALHRLGVAPGASGTALPRYAEKARDYLVFSPLTTTAR
ncbi:DUF6603 domain-containing protein [Streptomyces coffeae]|uniref:DUF6603 domain-containing protein n=1 Tax=Streptomyces coffeae TaxID=621382 RepID=A0ABS1NS60_9ACTN|nr:DUF6603 domain-containing protein [Streptomyces coffeae]MBL1102581.1 hypothetical protein [Streptomyces coffeae]